MVNRTDCRLLLCVYAWILVAGCTGTTTGPTNGSTTGPVENTGSTKPPLDRSPGGAPIPSPSPARAYYTICNGEQKDLAELLKPIVRNLVQQQIPYPPYQFSRRDAKQWRDCSGNFLRLTSYLAGRCPELSNALVAPSGIRKYRQGQTNVVPLAAGARSTRNIAKWFHEQPGFLFQPIYYDDVKATPRKRAISRDLNKYRNLIRPGAVLWFAHTMPTSSRGLPALFTYVDGARRHINHMGTVTAVERDGVGRVVGLSMYHGRNPAKGSGVTHHEWSYSGNSDYPPFGVGSQFLVAIGALAPLR